MTLKPTQIKYLLNRVNDIKHDKIRALKQSDYETKSVLFEPKKRFKLFKEGRFTLNPRLYEKTGNPFENDTCLWYFKDSIVCEGETAYRSGYEAYKKDAEKIEQEAQKVKDAIVLGDSEEAMHILKAFEDFKVK